MMLTISSCKGHSNSQKHKNWLQYSISAYKCIFSHKNYFKYIIYPTSVAQDKIWKIFIIAIPFGETKLTHWSQRYRRRYQLGFFKISAKDTKNTLLILVTQISVIHNFEVKYSSLQDWLLKSLIQNYLVWVLWPYFSYIFFPQNLLTTHNIFFRNNANMYIHLGHILL